MHFKKVQHITINQFLNIISINLYSLQEVHYKVVEILDHLMIKNQMEVISCLWWDKQHIMIV